MGTLESISGGKAGAWPFEECARLRRERVPCVWVVVADSSQYITSALNVREYKREAPLTHAQ